MEVSAMDVSAMGQFGDETVRRWESSAMEKFGDGTVRRWDSSPMGQFGDDAAVMLIR